MTALILAIENGHFELAADLLEAGADPNARPAGFTALHAITWVRKPIRGDGNPPPPGRETLSSLDFVRQLGETRRGREHPARERASPSSADSRPRAPRRFFWRPARRMSR